MWWKKLPRIICIFKHFLVRHRKVTKVYEWLVSVYVVIKWSNNPFSTNLFLVFTVETTGYYVFGLIIIQGAVVKSGAWLYAAGTLGVVHGLFLLISDNFQEMRYTPTQINMNSLYVLPHYVIWKNVEYFDSILHSFCFIA